MRNNIRISFAVAMIAVAASAASASAAPPVWFDGADQNTDGAVTWREYVRFDRAFAILDANGDDKITAGEGYGPHDALSSFEPVKTMDIDRSGSVTRYEYTKQLRAIFDAVDVDRDGTISEHEANGTV